MKNPAWLQAEKERLAAEDKYTAFRTAPETLLLRENKPEEWDKKIRELNANIEAANKKVRTIPQEL